MLFRKSRDYPHDSGARTETGRPAPPLRDTNNVMPTQDRKTVGVATLHPLQLRMPKPDKHQATQNGDGSSRLDAGHFSSQCGDGTAPGLAWDPGTIGA
jgi:hypothetical protein